MVAVLIVIFDLEELLLWGLSLKPPVIVVVVAVVAVAAIGKVVVVVAEELSVS